MLVVGRRLAILARTLGAVLRPPRARTFPALTAANLPPMRGRLELIRDRNGVAHVYAEQEPDLFAALGYLQAADRLFFIDLIRHLGAGRLRELVGNLAVPRRAELFGGRRIADLDAFVRPLAFEAQSRADFARLGPRAAACLESFAAGINAALRAMRGAYPPEYLLAGAVQPWHPADALLNARTCAFVVSLTGFENELTFDAVRGRLGDDGARRLYPDAPWEHVPTSYEPKGDVPEPEAPIHLPGGGSNNWAVGPSRTATGAPLVANDPHVPLFPLPTFWHHVHLDCPAYRVQGGVFPGCPIFGFGHNGALAWGCTTGFRDAYDLYRIHRLPGDPTRYRTVDGCGAISRHRERLRTRLGRELAVEWEECEHGIIYPGWRHHDGVDLAVRAVPCDLAAYFEGYLALAESQTVEAHRRALERINEGPCDFNHVYAHTAGHFGWELFGRAPRRRRDGLFVRDAHDPDAQWEGFIPFAEMPKLLNPGCGFVASANSTTDPDQHARVFTVVHCEPRYRQGRMESVLAGRDTHTPETFAALQSDVVADYAPALRDALVRAIGEVRDDPVAAQALECLASWDGTFPTDSSGAPIYARLMPELARRVFQALLGPELGTRFAGGRRGVPRLHRLLLDPADPLLGDIERAAHQPVAKIVRAAFLAVVDETARRHGSEPRAWRWGAVHRVWLGTPLGVLPGFRARFVALDADFPGDEYTVSPSRPLALNGRLYALIGASSRFICDLSTPDEALFAHSAGPSADPGTTFFANLSCPWHRFEYFRSALWKANEVPAPAERLVIPPCE